MSEVLLQAIRDKHHPDEISQLIAEGADVNYQDKNGITALMEASLALNLPMMIKLLEVHRAKIDKEDVNKQTALNHAYVKYLGDEATLFPIIDLLLTKSADPNHPDQNNNTLLQWAAFHGHINIARRALTAGVDPNSAYNDAFEGDHQEMINLILHAIENYIPLNDQSELNVGANNNMHSLCINDAKHEDDYIIEDGDGDNIVRRFFS